MCYIESSEKSNNEMYAHRFCSLKIDVHETNNTLDSYTQQYDTNSISHKFLAKHYKCSKLICYITQTLTLVCWPCGPRFLPVVISVPSARCLDESNTLRVFCCDLWHIGSWRLCTNNQKLDVCAITTAIIRAPTIPNMGHVRLLATVLLNDVRWDVQPSISQWPQ